MGIDSKSHNACPDFRSIMFWTNNKSLSDLKQWGSVEEITGYSTEEFRKNKSLWADIVYSEDQEYFFSLLMKLEEDPENDKEIPVEYRITHKEGMLRHVIGVIRKRTVAEVEYSGYLVDLSRMNSGRGQVVYKDKLLGLLYQSMSELFKRDQDRKSSIDTVLRNLSKITSVDRIYIFETKNESNEKPVLDYVYEWCAEGIEPQKDSEGINNFDFAEGSPRWYTLMVEKKRHVSGQIRMFPPEEKEFLEPQGIKSLLAVPIWMEGKFFGFIGFDDCTDERFWSDEEIQLLSLFALLISVSWKFRKASEQLQLSFNELLRVEKEREQFYKMLVHQFKTPLSVLEMNSDMMSVSIEDLDRHIPGGIHHFTERIHRSVEKMRKMLDAILIGEIHKSYSLETDILKPQFLIEKILAKNDMLGRVPVVLESTLEKNELVMLPISQSLYEYIIDTVLNNAQKYSLDSKDPIQIKLKREAQFLLLEVTDFGVGIPKSEVENIGTPFYRASNVINKEGVGVGLTILKSSLESVGGSFVIESEEGKFTRVSIAIPLQKSAP